MPSLRFGVVSARPDEEVRVVAPVAGRMLVAPAVAVGDAVEAGQLIATMVPLVDTASRATVEAQRRQLRGQAQSAAANATALEAEVARMQTLEETQLATAAELARARADLAAQRAQASSLARAEHELGRMTRGAIELRAPIAGVVAELTTEVGMLLAQGDLVARVTRPGPRWIDIAVPPLETVGARYRVRFAGGRVEATLLARGALVGADGMRRDRLLVEAADELLLGATVAVEVVHEQEGVSVPQGALASRGAERVVFVEVSDSRFEARVVQVTALANGAALLEDAVVEEGESVVSQGAPSLLGELEGVGGPNEED
ncbi:MAG: HlyD family efflux transporter periplasmic adaptor subunit [Myxococcota bacterium]|nr:HlyD family efflux transporter periplasmic adaptor subunit [Myxococcota bacterium]